MDEVVLVDKKRDEEIARLRLERVPCVGEWCLVTADDAGHLYRVDHVLWGVNNPMSGREEREVALSVTEHPIDESDQPTRVSLNKSKAHISLRGTLVAAGCAASVLLPILGRGDAKVSMLSAMVGVIGWVWLAAHTYGARERTASEPAPDNVVAFRAPSSE